MGDEGGARVRREARWFLDGDVPRRLRPTGPSRRRVDAYEITTLRPWAALKRRGGAGALERKVRVGRVELVERAGAVGFAETWQKVAPEGPPIATARWLEVHKELWTHRELEIGRCRIGRRRGWTVCVALDRTTSAPALAVLDRWAPLLHGGTGASYPAWIAHHLLTDGG